MVVLLVARYIKNNVSQSKGKLLKKKISGPAPKRGGGGKGLATKKNKIF